MSPSPISAGTLTARPSASPPLSPLEPGIHPLRLGNDIRDGRLYVPRPLPGLPPDQPRPLLVVLHGAGTDASSLLRLFGASSTAHNCVLLAPDSRARTWDFLLEDFGPDVSFLDRALALAFDRCHIDPTRIALAGFSDGASYALSLGLANGDLFTHVMALSPGFMRPPRLRGHPRLFVSHGTGDEVLPIARCSRRLVPQLQSLGYELTYREFQGGHVVPAPILAEGMQWFTGHPGSTVPDTPLT